MSYLEGGQLLCSLPFYAWILGHFELLNSLIRYFAVWVDLGSNYEVGILHKRDPFWGEIGSRIFARSRWELLFVLSWTDSPSWTNLEMSSLDISVNVGWQFVVQVYILVAPEWEVSCCLSAKFSPLLSKSHSVNFHFPLYLKTFKTSTEGWVASLKSWLVVGCHILVFTAQTNVTNSRSPILCIVSQPCVVMQFAYLRTWFEVKACRVLAQ